MSVYLSELYGRKWYHKDNIWCCGFAHTPSGLLEGKTLGNFFLKAEENKTWAESLTSITGSFSVIIQTAAGLKAATDTARSIPLFYANYNGEWLLSNDANLIQRKSGFKEVSPVNAVEFLLSGFVTGAETLLKDIRQVQAGETIELINDNENPATKRYFTFSQQSALEETESELCNHLHQVHINIFKKLIDSLDGRTAIIPLSGGFDSRLIACMMEELGYTDIQYMTYGTKGNWESKVAKEITDHFGKELIFVPNSYKKISKWFHANERKLYSDYAGNLSSHAHLQDFGIVWELKEKNLIPEDSVFIPGHSGGLMAGMHTPKSFIGRQQLADDDVVNHIINKNYTRFKWQNSDHNKELEASLSQKISTLIAIPKHLSGKEGISFYEQWNWQERQSKYIINSVRVYDFWGFDWRLPLFDRDLMNFWGRVPENLRAKRNLYKTYIEKYHPLEVTDANSKLWPKIKKRINPFENRRYGRFLHEQKILKLPVLKEKDILSGSVFGFPFLNPDKRVLFESPEALTGALFMDEILTDLETQVEI